MAMPENPMAIIEGLQRDLMNIQREIGAIARFLIPPGGPGPFGAGGIPPFFNPGAMPEMKTFPMPDLKTFKVEPFTYAKGLIMPESVMDQADDGADTYAKGLIMPESVVDEVAEGSGEEASGEEP